jgi:hypothetical protein
MSGTWDVVKEKKSGPRGKRMRERPTKPVSRDDRPPPKRETAATTVNHSELLEKYIDFGGVQVAVLIDLTDAAAADAAAVPHRCFSPSVARVLLGACVPDGVAVLVFAPKDPTVLATVKCSECGGPAVPSVISAVTAIATATTSSLGAVPSGPLSSTKGRFVVYAGPATAAESARKMLAVKLFEAILTAAAGSRPRHVYVSASDAMFEAVRKPTAGWQRKRFNALDGGGTFVGVGESFGLDESEEEQQRYHHHHRMCRDEKPQDPVACAVLRCREWFARALATGRPLPASEAKLTNSLRSVCIIRREIGRAGAREAIAYLHDKGCLTLCTGCNRPRFAGVDKLSDPDGGSGGNSPAVQRAVAWVRSHKHLDAITSNSALLSHIAALPIVCHVPPAAVLDVLVADGTIERFLDGRVALANTPAITITASGCSRSHSRSRSPSPSASRSWSRSPSPQRDCWDGEMVEEPIAMETCQSDQHESSPVHTFREMQLFREVIQGAEDHGIASPTPFQ